MTGPEHYRRAEALLESCQLTSDRDADGTVTEIYPDREDNGAGELTDSTSHALMAAQAHATMAHAAATALARIPLTSKAVDAWGRAIS